MCDFFIYKNDIIFLIVSCDSKYNFELLKDFKFICNVKLKPKKRVFYRFLIMGNKFFEREIKVSFSNYEEIYKKILIHT